MTLIQKVKMKAADMETNKMKEAAIHHWQMAQFHIFLQNEDQVLNGVSERKGLTSG